MCVCVCVCGCVRVCAGVCVRGRVCAWACVYAYVRAYQGIVVVCEGCRPNASDWVMHGAGAASVCDGRAYHTQTPPPLHTNPIHCTSPPLHTRPKHHPHCTPTPFIANQSYCIPRPNIIPIAHRPRYNTPIHNNPCTAPPVPQSEPQPEALAVGRGLGYITHHPKYTAPLHTSTP